MIDCPFSIFAPYADRLRVGWFEKADAVRSDEEVARALDCTDYAGLWQVHGNRSVRVDGPSHSTEQADGLATEAKGLALCIRCADCQTFVIYAPERGVVGLVHAGWRGVNCGALEGIFELLRSEWSIEPAETLVGAAPALCTQCADFTNPLEELPNIDPSFFHDNCVDLMGAAEKQLRDLGVTQFERMEGCTRCHPDRFWTYRGGDRDAVKNGDRNVLAAVLL